MTFGQAKGADDPFASEINEGSVHSLLAGQFLSEQWPKSREAKGHENNARGLWN